MIGFFDKAGDPEVGKYFRPYENHKSIYQKYIRVALILLTSFPKAIIIGSDFSTPK